MLREDGTKIFPRFGPHVSWRQRWHFGTDNKAALNTHEKPLRGHDIQIIEAENRVMDFRETFNEYHRRVAAQLRNFLARSKKRRAKRG